MPGINKIKLANVDYDIVPIKYGIRVVYDSQNSLALYNCATNQIVSTNEHEINAILNEYVSSYSSKSYPAQIIFYNKDFGVEYVLLTYDNTDKVFTGENSSIDIYYQVSLDAEYEDGSGNMHDITIGCCNAVAGYVNQFSTIGEVANRTLVLYNFVGHIDHGAYNHEFDTLLYPSEGIS